MTRRTEFTASIQSEVRFGKTRTLPRERNASTERVGTGLRRGATDQALKTKILRLRWTAERRWAAGDIVTRQLILFSL